jgi:hypothetical protein
MRWEKRLSKRAATDGGWREDFPLGHQLPEDVLVDCSALELPVYPLFVVRLRMFLEWHLRRGRSISVIGPTDPRARRMLESLRVTAELPVETDLAERRESSQEAIVLPVTPLREYAEVEDVALRTREILEYQQPKISALGHASYMAVSELCANAVEHGANEQGSFVAAARFDEPRAQVSIAIGDLGVGIPEHLRQRYPEWFDDCFAIAQAFEPSISGTGNPHRGNGFAETFEAALVSAMHAARVDIHSANGFVRGQFYGGTTKLEPFPAASFRRGTWISYDLVASY